MNSSAVYIAVLLYKADSDEPGFIPVYEERFYLLMAQSMDEARRKTEAIRAKSPHSYQNADAYSVTWTCVRVVDVAETVDTELVDGAELYGRYFRNLDAYEHFEPHLKGPTRSS